MLICLYPCIFLYSQNAGEAELRDILPFFCIFLASAAVILGVCGLRSVWIYTIFQIPQYHTPQCLYLSYLVSWVITFIVQLAAFLIVFRRYLKTAE